MKKFNLSPLVVFLFVIFNLFSSCPRLQAETKIIGYYPNWGMYRNPAFFPKDINASLVTHINYAFIKLAPTGELVLFDPWSDVQHGEDWNNPRPYSGNFKQLNDLKKQYPHLKTLASVGGWTLSDTFSQVADNAHTRATFIKSCLQFCEKYNFDGIDIDWEYPGFAEHSGRPQDKQNFTLLLSELHKAAKAHNPPLLVTIAAPAGPHHYVNMEVAAIHQYLDWINLMCYDFHGAWGGDDITNHQAALYQTEQGHPDFNTNSAVTYYVQQGVPAEKIVIGMPFYGRSFGGVKSDSTGLHSLYTCPGTGTTAEAGMRFYYDIKQNLLPHYDKYWDDTAQVPYLYSPTKKEFVTYDDARSIGLKAKYVKDHGFGGAMIWELGLDDRSSWELLNTIHSILKQK